MATKERPASEQKMIQAIADFLEHLGAPHSLIVDWIIRMDNPELFEGIEPRRRHAILKAAKRETSRRYIALRIEDACNAVELDEDEVGATELAARKRAAVLADIDEVVATTAHMRELAATTRGTEEYLRIRDQIGKEHGSSDCFDLNVRRQYARIAREELPDVFGRKPSTAVERQGIVYLISLGDPTLVKIGFTTNLPHRLRTFRTATHGEVTVHLAIAAPSSFETELHQRFEAHCAGREWFRLQGIQDFIESEKTKAETGE